MANEREVIDRMVADGASHEQIMDFVQKAKAQRASAPTSPNVLDPRANRLAALDAGEADAMFEAKKTGRAAPGIADWLQGHVLGMPGEMRAQMDLHTNPAYMKQRAELGDPAAGAVASGQEAQQQGLAVGRGLAAGAGAGGLVSEALSPAVTSPGLVGVAGRAGVAALSGAAGGAAGGAAEAATQGRPIGDAAMQGAAGGSLGGAVMSPAFDMMGFGAQKVFQGLRNSKGVGPYLKAKDAGVYEKPEMTALSPGPEGMQEAADTAVESISGRESRLHKEASDNWNLTGQDPKVLAKPVDAGAIRDKLVAAQLEHIDPDTGMPASKGAEAISSAYQDAIDRTGAKATVAGVLKRRQSLRQAAAFDSPNPSDEQRAARDVYQTFRAALRDASPELKAADDAYAAYERGSSKRAELAGVNDLEKLSPNDREKAAANIGRIGDENVAGLRKKKRLEELRGTDPEVGSAMAMVAAKKAQENVRPGMPHMPTHLTPAAFIAGIPRAIGQNARALGAHVLDPSVSALMDVPNAALRGGAAGMRPFAEDFAAALARLQQQGSQ